jgi:hypothetical protein
MPELTLSPSLRSMNSATGVQIPKHPVNRYSQKEVQQRAGKVKYCFIEKKEAYYSVSSGILPSGDLEPAEYLPRKLQT